MKILKLLAKTKGITIKDLSKQSGVTQSTLHNLLSGRSAGHRDKLIKIAAVLEVPLPFLLVSDEMADAIEERLYQALKVTVAHSFMREISEKPLTND